MSNYSYEVRCRRLSRLLELRAPYYILRNEMNLLDETYMALPAEKKLMLNLDYIETPDPVTLAKAMCGVHD